MNKFSDLGIIIEDDKTVYNCRQISITDIVNCEIVVLDYINEVKTRHGDHRYLIHMSNNGIEGKFFTNSKHIKDTLDAIPKNNFPFETTIKCVNYGMNKLYKFT